jgi:hypothetical protein
MIHCQRFVSCMYSNVNHTFLSARTSFTSSGTVYYAVFISRKLFTNPERNLMCYLVFDIKGGT